MIALTLIVLLCVGVDDTTAIQSALDQGGLIQLAGSCRITQTLQARTSDTALRGPADLIVDGPTWGLLLTTRELLVENVTWWNATGGGIAVDTPVTAPFLAGGLRVIGGQFNTSYPGVYAWKGTGLWIWGTHFNGLNGGTYAAMVFEWDTAFFTDVLVEEHWACLRFGSGGMTANISLMNVKCDRLRSVGHVVEPWGSGSVQNLQDWNGWWAGGLAPYLINAGETTGYVGRLLIRNGLARDESMHSVWFNGPVDRTTIVTEIQHDP